MSEAGRSEPRDPLLAKPANTVQEGDHFILIFGDGRQYFGQCSSKRKGQLPPVKINKKAYNTRCLVGLPYGSVLEQGASQLQPLPAGEGLLPSYPALPDSSKEGTPTPSSQNNSDTDNDNTEFPARDNRHYVDDNTSQSLGQDELVKLRESGTEGAEIVERIIQNSATFSQKTLFGRAKYVARKQLKYQPRCRIVRCTPATICEALFLRDPKKIMNLREDTLGQILSLSNVSAGCQVLVLETTMGLITGALAQRMGGYGKILSVYSGQQPSSFQDLLSKYNLTFGENFSIKWVHSGDVFGSDDTADKEEDLEKADREVLQWPCPLQDHTRRYLESMSKDTDRTKFLARRSARFARKLTRHTPMEGKQFLTSRKSDSLVIVARYDPTETLMAMLPFLAPSCSFVVFCEFIEPLTRCFLELQRRSLAINLRLTETWAREYQILPGRTHPNMNMSQSGGYILTGVKLCPVTGLNELDEDLLKEIRLQVGGRRGKKSKSKADRSPNESVESRKTRSSSKVEGLALKKQRTSEAS